MKKPTIAWYQKELENYRLTVDILERRVAELEIAFEEETTEAQEELAVIRSNTKDYEDIIDKLKKENDELEKENMQLEDLIANLNEVATKRMKQLAKQKVAK